MDNAPSICDGALYSRRIGMNQKVLQEMLEYIDTQTGLSYYEFKAYCYENDKDDWINMLHDYTGRGYIRLYLQEKRKKEKIKYKTDIKTSLRHSLDAEKEYIK